MTKTERNIQVIKKAKNCASRTTSKKKKKRGAEWRKQKAVDWLVKNKGWKAAEDFISKQSSRSRKILRNRVLRIIEVAPATKHAPAIEVQILRNSPLPVVPAADSRNQKFYCTVCKMKTWTFHEHDGLNTSSTKRHVKVPGDSTNISK